jgi:hypothetical protein
MLAISMASTSFFTKYMASASGESWLSGWQYRKSHVINPATDAGTGYQTRIKVSYSTSAPTWFTVLSTNIPLFMTNDISSNGTIFAGDNNYNIYKSIDNGTTFTKIFTIQTQPNPWGLMAGRVWTTFVDSRNYVFVSAGGTNRLYRSTNYGTSFDMVLNVPDRSTYSDAHIISMTEDADHNLYAAEYADTMPPGGSRLWKSTDSGATWTSVSKTWSARHLHDVKYNPYNGWLYVVVGEGGGTEYQTVWRSKNLGDTWACVVAWGSDVYATKYVPIEFMGSDVYLGQDHQGGSETNLIQKITDDGIHEPFTPVTVYNNPYTAAIMISATKLGNTMIFSTCSESYDPATCQVVMSNDGSTWTRLNAQVVSTTYKYINRLTVHPRTGFVYGCINYNYAYFIADPSTPRPPSFQPPLNTVFAEGHCKTDFGDIRFTDDDGTTLLDYWMETKTNGDNAIFWVEVADNLGSSQTIYVYYGKSDATTTSNPGNTFLFYDDFSGDLSKWTIISGAGAWGTDVAGNLVIEPATDNNYLVTSTDIGANSIAIKTKMQSTQAGDSQAHPGLIWHANALTGGSHQNDQVYFRPHDPSTNIVQAYFSGSVNVFATKGGSYYSFNTWATVEVRIPSSGNVKLYGNDVYWHDWGNQHFSNNRVGLMAHGNGKDYYDYFSVRKYVEPEPTHGAWGSEEIPQNPPSISNPSPANGATDVPTSLSQLSFDLADINNNLMNYEVTTSPNIGSGSGTGVINARYTITVNGLQRNTAYTWRVRAIDPLGSNSWTDVTFSFRTSGYIGQSWLPGWQYRKSHVITQAAGAGTGYQTRVKVSYSALAPASWFTILPTNIPVFMTTDVSSNGTVFAGDMNYNVYKSADSGVTFTNIFSIPQQSNPWGVHAGKVWTVFVDSRDNLLVSAGGTNRIYRCLNGSTSFTQVLDMSRGSNDAMIISMTEDDLGYLYAAEYGDGRPARLWKSTDGGTNWNDLRDWDARHLHAVKFNPSNKWLYVVVGENSDGSQTEYQTVWRSKDRGATWDIIVERGPGTDTKYLPIEFIGNNVYLGQDRNGASDTDDIHKITDDGAGPYTPSLAYDNPDVAAIMTAATKLDDTIIFTTSSEGYTSTCKVVMSKDGTNWTVLNAQSVSPTYRWINELTVHPRKGIVYGCINANYGYYIASPSTPRPPPLQSPASAETVLAEGHCKTDFGDIRFTDDDGVTPLDYWMETKVDGEYATFWVKVSDDLSSVDRTIYVYYGKSDATTTSNPDNTFLFFDDFNGGLSKWTTISGTWTTEGGNLTIQPSTIRNNYLITQSTFATSNIAIRTKIASTPPTSGETQAHPGVIWHANTLTGTDQRNDQVYFRPHNTGPSGYGNIQPAYYDGTGGIENSGLHFYDDKKGSYYNWNTWSLVDVGIAPSGNVKLYGNNLYWHNWDNQQFTNDRIGLVAHEGGKDYFDYFAVRKYVDPEPTHSTWGTEETLTINSCNSAGTNKSDFNAGEEIWVNGSKGYSPSTTYPIFVVTDIEWSNGMSIPTTRVEGTVQTVTSNPDGSILAKVWASASPGKYDIVIDFDGDGVYDEGLDPLDNNQVVGTAGFFVIPEYALGTILALAVCFAGVAVYQRSKLAKRRTL